ncbi:hypothetical protein F5Y15DRAFT_409027 [Xylariaceae sp. FL0016]|nr:hypothetical protein F5Y15DRAFT_409027 [Xylariaceae sp. FL0016]
MLSSALLASVGLSAIVSAVCDRALLQNATSQYVTAQNIGSSSALTYLAPNVTYTENEKSLDIKTGVLSQALKLDHNRSIHDTTGCATFTELIAASDPHPYVIGTRMQFGSDSKIAKIESIVTDQGDWLFNATGYLHWDSLEKWDPIPEDKRDTYATIKAAGDAYFDRFKNENQTVPWGTPCARLEGGAYTDSSGKGGNTCNLGVPSTIVVTNRRYVVDEEMGTVDILLGFPQLDMTVPNQSMPDSHMFRVEGGKIRYIHTVSSCVTPGCGANFTSIPGRRRQLRPSRRLY